MKLQLECDQIPDKTILNENGEGDTSHVKDVETSPCGRYEKLNELIFQNEYEVVYRGEDSETYDEITWTTIKLNKLSITQIIKIKS